MSRRTRLPGAAELFRSTGDGLEEAPAPVPASLGRAQRLLAEPPHQGDQTRPDETGRDETVRDRNQPDRNQPDRNQPDQTQPDQTQPDQTQPDQTLRYQTQRDQSWRGQAQAGNEAGGPALAGTAHGPGATRPPGRRRVAADAERRPTGRERHDEKITVYVSAEELMDLERARLTLRGEHGLAVDRGRIVREALALVLADLEGRGEASSLVHRLHGN